MLPVQAVYMTLPVSSLRLLLAAGLVTLAYGCAPTPPVDEPDVAPEEVVDRLTPREYMSRAEEAAERGQRRQAAEWFESAASATDDPGLRHEALLRAGEMWLRLTETEAAAASLSKIDPDRLIGDEPVRYRLARAETLIRMGNPAAARVQLSLLPSPPDSREKTYYELRARVAEALDQHLAVVRLRSKAEAYLERPSERDRNRQLLWASLSRVPVHVLESLTEPEEEVVQGWFDLALLTRSYRLNPDRLGDALDSWTESYPDHPALDRQVPQIVARYQEQFRPPQRIALMLPLSGELRDAARAVRDGVLAAYYAAPGDRPEITIYDTAGDKERVIEMYYEAAAAGAEHIIGPLTKDELAALASVDDADVPVLALNTTDSETTPPSGIFQFALDPEAEAAAAADHAYARGWRNVVVLVPDNSWGVRIASAFDEAFAAHPDTAVLQIAAYDPNASDHAGPLRSALNLDASDRRYRQLAGQLGQRLEFTPRRRQDVDGIFLAAFPQQARLLRPQIEYHHAQDLPVLATSHVYAGRHDPDRDRDLNGLYFLDGPWMVDAAAAVGAALERASLREIWGDPMDRYARLTALGIDAYRILPYLEILQDHPDESIDGLTGQLRVRSDGHIERGLVPAQFRGGRALFRPMPSVAAPWGLETGPSAIPPIPDIPPPDGTDEE